MLWLMDSFDHYDSIDQINQKHTQVYQVTGGIPPILASGVGRNGTTAMRFTVDNDHGYPICQPVAMVIPSASSYCIVGFRFKASGPGSWANNFDFNGDFYPWCPAQSFHPRARNFILQIRHQGYGQCTMTVRQNGQLLFYVGQAVNDTAGSFELVAQTLKALQWGRWYYIEVKVHSALLSAGSIELHVNGDTWLAATGVKTSYPGGIDGPAPPAGWDEVIFGKNTADTTNAFAGAYTGVGHWDFDDMYIADGISSVPWNTISDFWGDKRIDWRPVTADGVYTEWTTSAGSDHYALVDEYPHTDDADYVQASGVGLRDSYEVANALVPGYNIDAMQIIGAIKRVQGGASRTALGFRYSGVDYLGSGIGNTGEYSFQRELFTRIPSSGYPAITDTVFNAIEALIKKEV